MEIKQVTLKTRDIKEMKNFYTNTLGLPLTKENEYSFQVVVGSSQLEFTEKDVEGEPYYHFAFNIQGNKFYEAKSWIKERVNLNVEDGEDEAEFSHSDAHSLYFYDPAGNIVEFISRHSISEAGNGPFSPRNILNISEISLTVDDSIIAGQQLIDIGIKERGNYQLSATSLNFMGDSTTGVFMLLIQPGRRWIFSDKISAIYPLDITLSTNNRIIINDNNELIINSNV
ncbi:VOC family protein [Aquibacillus rhizosphaerae]|uniref:VOC family protein n=1 Tax=Aquibacillus rhizosphaerae TaxID=3051431 RepID=A0ABT7L950_9BACI|nr:VOC family protein [Aquibacillus sp. LR5S19]MDL4842397.1 VOC family protein [Aquibacillus sp. LR5S19]